ncbi:MAG: chitobiase/beta-hexosaminidase C-terminal domain-containing protein, partial [Pirellulales bacterium]
MSSCGGRWIAARYSGSGRKSRRLAPRRLQVESLEGRQLLAADVTITELMASNGNTLLDEDGASSDWIELFNRGDATVSLDGWFLTDDAATPEKWQLPGVTLDPGAYLVVFASGKDRAPAVGELHTNFKLSASGEYVGLIEPGGTVVSEFGSDGTDYPTQFTDISYGATPAGSRFFAEPTPGEPNADGFLEFLGETTASVPRGFFDAPFTVELSTSDEGATIRYTTDGSRPSESNGTVYSGPIPISGTTTLRSAAFKADARPGPVDTQTYLFPNDVLRQSAMFGKDGNGVPPTAPWGQDKTGDGVLDPDWDVDPEIVNHPIPENRLTARDLRSVPTISVTLPWEEMFGGDGEGIYIDGDRDPRGASIEQILPDGSTGFQIDGSVQIQGNSSAVRWKVDKLSMRVKFTRAFGATKLNAPLFGEDATDRFDTFILDAVHNFSWVHRSQLQADDAKYIQDQFVANLHNATGGASPHGNYQYLYINGIFWGMYYVHERADASFAASYFGGDKDDYDFIKHDPIRNVNENPENYFAMLDLSNEDLSDDTNYQNLARVLDIEGLIDYVLVNFYVGNNDWGEDNWFATFNRNSPDGKWRFHSWDAEEVLNDVNDTKTANKNNPRAPTGIHQRLMANAEYRLLFADRVQKHYFNGGVLTPEKTAAEYGRLMAQVDRAIVGESARWGDNRRDSPYTRQEWLATQQKRLDGFFPQRTAISLSQFKELGLFPDTDSPSLNQHGGRIARSFEVELTAPAGIIYYTTDGTDPRLPGGAIASGAVEYTGPFQLDGTSP